MPITQHESFQELSDSDFKSYAESLLDSFSSSQKRKEVIAFLQNIQSDDKALLTADRNTLRAKLRDRSRKQGILDDLIAAQQFDFSRTFTLFDNTPATNTELAVLMGTANAEVYLKGRALVGTMYVTGDNVLIDGGSNGKSARTGALQNTASVLGDIVISGNGCVIRGVDFTSSTDQALRFSGSVVNVTVQDCKFTAGAGITDSEFWYGPGLEGNLTLKNCYITGFTGVHLFDANTSSSTPTVAMKRVRITKNYWKDNLGSIAVRGLQSDPTKLVQFNHNLFESAVQHSLYWDQTESSNHIKLEVIGNEATGEVGNDTAVGKRGFLQSWSRSNKPWILTYRDNILKNFKVGGKIVNNSTFYAVNEANDNFLIDISSLHTNVAYAFSFKYKAESGDPGYPTASANKWLPAGNGIYRPENISVHAVPPTVTNPNNYTLVN